MFSIAFYGGGLKAIFGLSEKPSKSDCCYDFSAFVCVSLLLSFCSVQPSSSSTQCRIGVHKRTRFDITKQRGARAR